MFQFIHEAGFGIIPTLAFGLAALFVGVRQIRSPERRRVTTAAWLIGLTLAAGALECQEVPLEETLEIARTLDELRGQWGLRYPADGATS